MVQEAKRKGAVFGALVFCTLGLLGCSAPSSSVDFPLEPPAGAKVIYDGEISRMATRVELDILKGIDAKYKPVEGRIYSLPSGTQMEDVVAYFDRALPGWQSTGTKETSGAFVKAWTSGARVVSIGFVEDEYSLDRNGGPTLVVQQSRR